MSGRFLSLMFDAVADRYERGCDELLATVAGIEDLATEVRFAAPDHVRRPT